MTRAQQICIGALCVLVGFLIGERVGHFELTQPLAVMSQTLLDATEVARNMEASDRATEVKLHLAEIEAVQRSDTNAFLRMSCTWLRLKSSHLNPADFAGRTEEVRQLLERSQAKLAEFEKDGQPCGKKPVREPSDVATPSSTHSP